MDPASVTLAIGAASKAFSMLKRGFEVGRDIESMHGGHPEMDGCLRSNLRHRKSHQESQYCFPPVDWL
jgi:hypothetical protein